MLKLMVLMLPDHLYLRLLEKIIKHSKLYLKICFLTINHRKSNINLKLFFSTHEFRHCCQISPLNNLIKCFPIQHEIWKKKKVDSRQIGLVSTDC